MANSWSPERQARQAKLIRQWRPWEKSTGPRTQAVLPQGVGQLAFRQVNNHRLEGGGFKGCQLEIDCRREEARHPGSLCTPLPSRPLCFLNSPPDILGRNVSTTLRHPQAAFSEPRSVKDGA